MGMEQVCHRCHHDQVDLYGHWGSDRKGKSHSDCLRRVCSVCIKEILATERGEVCPLCCRNIIFFKEVKKNTLSWANLFMETIAKHPPEDMTLFGQFAANYVICRQNS